MEWSDMQINYLICIFINTEENFKKIWENYKKANIILTEFCPKLSLLHVIISSVIQFDKSFHPIVIYKIISFAY